MQPQPTPKTMSANDIKRPIETEMKAFEPYFKKQLKSPNLLLTIITNYILRNKGKQMRPTLVFLSALASGRITDRSYVAATLIELLHTATLVHDDVVDETYQRRGKFSVNAIWNSKIAVLVGDYFLARGLGVALESNSFDMLRIVSKAVKEISEGELVQIERARKLDITEQVYYEIIYKKTASLISACTEAGAVSAGAPAETVEQMRLFGEYLGIAFQIRDDLFDYEDTWLTGKPSGNDIKERKLTLPLIYALTNASAENRRQIMKLIRNHNTESRAIATITAFARDNGGIQYTTQAMNRYSDMARQAIAGIADSPAKQSLLALVEYNNSRKK